MHRIQKSKHVVVRKLKFTVQVAVIQRGLKNARVKKKKKKKRLQKCSLWCVGAELCDYNAKS